jgi:hypothetical protein
MEDESRKGPVEGRIEVRKLESHSLLKSHPGLGFVSFPFGNSKNPFVSVNSYYHCVGMISLDETCKRPRAATQVEHASTALYAGLFDEASLEGCSGMVQRINESKMALTNHMRVPECRHRFSWS